MSDGLGAWFRDTPESRQMLSEEELKLDRDEWKARAEAAEADRDHWRSRAAQMEIERNRALTVIEKVRAYHHPGNWLDGAWCAGCQAQYPCPTVRLLPEVTPPDAQR